MFVRFVVPRVDPNGGFFLAICRLAAALTETGHRCALGVPRSLNVSAPDRLSTLRLQTLHALPDTASDPNADTVALQRELAAEVPDVLVVAHEGCEVLNAAHKVAPTILHTQLSWPACPDSTRYWHRVGKPCAVRAGVKCLGLRPLLGCSGWSSVMNPQPVVRWRRLNDLLARGAIGVIAISGPQAALMRRHGVPEEVLTVIPNLGMRMRADEVADASAATPADDRSAVTYFGRLSKEKGGALLPIIAAAAPPPGGARVR